jgi:hypothetical protein
MMVCGKSGVTCVELRKGLEIRMRPVARTPVHFAVRADVNDMPARKISRRTMTSGSVKVARMDGSVSEISLTTHPLDLA